MYKTLCVYVSRNATPFSPPMQLPILLPLSIWMPLTVEMSPPLAPSPAGCRRRIRRVGTRLALTVFNFNASVRFGTMVAAAFTEWYAITSDTTGYKSDVMREIRSLLLSDRLARFTKVLNVQLQQWRAS
jgi:hypothetical protein